MIQKYFSHVLTVSGLVTMLPLAQFFAPTQVLAASQLQIGDAVGLLYAQHWGLLAFCFGALLLYAAKHPEHRQPVVLAAGLEKLGLCVLVALGWSNPALQGLHPVLWVDGLMVVLYAWWWFAPKPSSAPPPEQQRHQ